MNVQELIQEALENNEKVVIATVSPRDLFDLENYNDLSDLDDYVNDLMQQYLTRIPENSAAIKLSNIGFIDQQAEIYFDNGFGLTIYNDDDTYEAVILKDGEYLDRDYAEFHELDEDEMDNLIQNLQNLHS